MTMSTAASRVHFSLLILVLHVLVMTEAEYGGGSNPWGLQLKPRLRVNYLSQKSDSVHSFVGNRTHADHFKLLRSDGNSLLIGARNVVYNVSLDDLVENVDQRITWPSGEEDRKLCLLKGKSENECQNYIRVLAQTDHPPTLLVCGTNSFQPKCRTYVPSEEGNSDSNATATADPRNEEGVSFSVKYEFSGKGLCPYDPKHNSTAIFTGGALYSGTVADFSGTDALIYKDDLRTGQYDLKQLNAPDFVSSLEDDEHVYFFFRENAVEHINCGKAVYARVGRVCKSDAGGPRKFKHRFTSFIKARLNCSVAGNLPFFFDHIQATSNAFVKSNKRKEDNDVLYAVFTTAPNSIGGSAVCSFRLADIRASFDHAHFKGQQHSDAKWLPVRDEPRRRPGSCQVDSSTLDERELNFIKSHSLLDEDINSSRPPQLVLPSMTERFTVIGIDAGVKSARSPDDRPFDVLFVGTTRGKVIKVVAVSHDSDSDHSLDEDVVVVVEELQIFPYHVSVANVNVIKNRLVVLSDHEVKSLPLSRCESTKQVQSCEACVALRDPYCAWNVRTARCVDHTNLVSEVDASLLVQDVIRGRHEACRDHSENDVVPRRPRVVTKATTARLQTTLTKANEVDDDHEGPMSDEDEVEVVVDIIEDEEPIHYSAIDKPLHQSAGFYTGNTMTLVTFLVALVSLALGFVGGFLTSRRCSKQYTNCGTHHYLETQHSLNKRNKMGMNESGYTASPLANNNATALLSVPTTSTTTVNDSVPTKNTNLLVNVMPKDELNEKTKVIVDVVDSAPNHTTTTTATSTTSTATPTTTTTLSRNGTLCKKVYL